MSNAPMDGRGAAAKTKVGGNNGTTSLPQPSPNKQALLDWQPVGDVALDIVDKLARQRRRCEVNQKLAEWIIDLRARMRWNNLHLLEGDFHTTRRHFEAEITQLARLIAVVKDRRP